MKIKHLLMIAGVAAIVACLGCVPKSHLKHQYDAGLQQGRTESVRGCAEAVYQLRADLNQKNERLAKFNQLNKDGTLRNANPCFDHPNSDDCKGWDQTTGKESWQK